MGALEFYVRVASHMILGMIIGAVLGLIIAASL